MQAHEVPTHVQAEDRVLLWLTFPQIVAMTAVCALAYGLYHYAPVGPSGVRIAAAVLFGLCGLRRRRRERIGGRRLPLVAARPAQATRWGRSRYAGPPGGAGAQRAAPAPLRAGTPTRCGCWRGACVAGSGERRNGRMPFRPHRLFGKPRRTSEEPESDKRATARDGPRAAPRLEPPRTARTPRLLEGASCWRRRSRWSCSPPCPWGRRSPRSPEDEGWSSDAIEFQPAAADRRTAALRRGTDGHR